MGNCQAAAAAAVVIHHPSGRAEISYCSLTAKQVMSSHPGHYVAVIATVHANSKSKSPVKYLKLLRPDDALLFGQVYRLVTFEDVLREFGSERRVRLNRLLAKRKEKEGGGGGRRGGENSSILENSSLTVEEQQQEDALEEVIPRTNATGINGSNNGILKLGQWRPTLRTIAEMGN